MAFEEEDFLQLSGLQHFAFCRRQWALIHIENQWAENVRTVEGDLFHARVHDEKHRERRGNILILRGLPVFSSTLGLTGKCDVVEFHAIPAGALYYGETRRRTKVHFTSELRWAVAEFADEMHQLYRRSHTPKVKPTKACNACSLKELCLPGILRKTFVAAYLKKAVDNPL